MLTIRCARQTRAFIFSPWTFNAAVLFRLSSSSVHPYTLSSFNSVDSSGFQPEIHRNEVVNYFREWFMSRKIPLFDRIFEILRTHEESSLDPALSCLNLYLTESLILDVLSYDQKDVLSCLKFFDWAGRQPGFCHTTATFNAMFRILSKSKLMNLMLDFLQTYIRQRYAYKVRYYNILVIGYAIAGKCETALLMFGKMRFHGVDLDRFSYHVLMNALVEHGYFDVVEMVANEITVRGFQNDITHSIMMKSFCKQKEFEKANEYLYNLAQDDSRQLSGFVVGTFVDALCKHNQFERAAMLVEEFRRKGLVQAEHAYGIWIKDLVLAGKLDDALEFLKDKQAVEGYVPDIFRYNMLISKLLREDRIEDVFDLLVDMKERDIVPDNVTMNSILCLLCKAGRMDIALDLYDSRVEFGLSVNYMAYNYLINTLVGGVSVDEAYRVLRSSIEHGYLPGLKTLSIIADALCREGRLDELKELILFAVNRKIMPNKVACEKFISALCKSRRVEEGYLIYDMLIRLNKKSRKSTYVELIRGSINSSRVDIAARLVINMLEKGYRPNQKLFREVICGLLKMDYPENQFFGLLDVLLARTQLPAPIIYMFFIDGAGHAENPELARQVYEMMKRSGVEPTLGSAMLLLSSYLNCGKIASAFQLFRDFSMRWCNRRLWGVMILGLCRAGKPEHALQLMDAMKAKNLIPKVDCYEELIKVYCNLGQYNKAIELVNDMTQMGRLITSGIGNAFLLHALKSRKVYGTWAHLSHKKNLTPACWMLGHIIGVFSGAVEGVDNVEELELVIQECFRMDTFTNNLLLRRVGMQGIDHACEYFNKLCEKGCEPNRWTYDIIVHGLAKNGRIEEAQKWMDVMAKKGFSLTETTMRYYV